MGAVLSVLIVYKLAFLRLRPVDVFGETMMLVYYGYALPLSLKIGRGFYDKDGIWADAGFIPYWKDLAGCRGARGKNHARPHLSECARSRAAWSSPSSTTAAARRLLRDKIATTTSTFAGKTLDLGMRDERDDV